jgi:hypothetical protein
MLFWTRAALCIGAVTVLAIGRLPSPPQTSATAVPARWPADLALAACRSRPDICVGAAARGWGALAPAGPQRSRGRPDPEKRAGAT